MNITKGRQVKPRRTLLYGVHGVGKSTWAADAPSTVFINLEDGLNDIDCDKSELILSWDHMIESLRWLWLNEHEYKHVAVDTIDWLERLIFDAVAKTANKESIADIGYGAGYRQALTYWEKLIQALECLRRDKGMGVILLAHADVKRFNSPEQESYDRYQPALHDLASSALQEWCDEVLFASYRVFIRKEDQGFNKDRNIAVSDGERFIRTQETAAVLAKNRLNMPAEIPFSWCEYAKHFPKAGNVAGIVKDGSSKVPQEA